MSEDRAFEFLASPLAKFKPWRTPDGRSPQLDFLRAAATHKARIFRAGNRAGKELRSDEPVLTPGGWRAIGSLAVGDSVYSEDGTPTVVTGVFPQGVKPMFRLTFNDGASVVCGEDHLWKVKTRNGRFSPDASRRSDPSHYGQWEVMSLRDIRARWGDQPKPINRVSIPVTKPVQLPEREQPLKPYLFGALVGDGSFVCGVRLTTADPEILDRCRSELPADHAMPRIGSTISYNITGRGRRRPNDVIEAIRSMGLYGKRSWEKSLPDIYLYGSVAQRVELLRGLMDADGTCSSGGTVEFSTTSEVLAQQVRFLVQSLGGKSSLRTRITRFTSRGGSKQDGRRSYRVSCRLQGINPFYLRRKAERYDEQVGWTYDRILTLIEPVEAADATCIAVAHASSTYLTRDCIVTHNSTINAWDHVAIAAGLHPFYPKRGPNRGWVVAVDWSQGIGTVLWPKIKSFLPMHLVKDISFMRRSAPEIPSAVLFKNGSEMHFKSADSGPSKFAGADLDWLLIDEEIEYRIVEECRARLLDRGGLLSVSLTPVSRMQWVADLESERDPDGNLSTKVVRASMRDAMQAGILDKRAVESFLANLPERQRRVREDGDFAALEGMVYPDFRRDTHCLRPKNGGLYDAKGNWVYSWPLPSDWRRFAAMDFGFTVPSALLVAVEDPYTGHFVVERCLYANGIRMSKWAEELRKGLLPKLEEPMVVDHDAMERAELAAAGIPTCKAAKHDTKVPGLEAVERWLMPMSDGRAKLQFVLSDDANPMRNPLTGRDDCHYLCWEMERYRYAEKKEKGPDVKDEPIKRDDHAMDALRYLVYFLDRRGNSAAANLPVFYPKPSPLDGLRPPSPWR